MKLGKFLLAVAAVLLVTPLAHADSTVTMVFTGVNGANDGHYYVSPYTGTMNGQNVVLFCDDIINDVSVGQTWQANVTNLGSGDLSNTRYGNAAIAVNSSVFNNAAILYQEAAYLTTQFASHPGDFVSLQYAIWDLMNPGAEPTSYGNVAYWLQDAAKNYQSIDPSQFSVVTNVGPLAMRGQVQEFIVRTPEPGTIALVLVGMIAMAIFVRRRGIVNA